MIDGLAKLKKFESIYSLIEGMRSPDQVRDKFYEVMKLDKGKTYELFADFLYFYYSKKCSK